MTSTKHLKGECQQCGGHLEFPAESAGMTTECPHCGKPTELFLAVPKAESSVPAKAIVYTILAIVILVGGVLLTQIALKRAQRLAQRTNASGASHPVAPAAPADSGLKNGFRVSEITLEKTPGSSLVHAVGTVHNETDRRRFGVRVEVDLLDAVGNKVGSAKDYQATLEAKAEWQFRALVVGSNVVSAALASINEDQ